MKTTASEIQSVRLTVMAGGIRRGIKIQIPEDARLYRAHGRPWRDIYSSATGFAAPGKFFKVDGVEVHDDHTVIHLCKGNPRSYQRRHLTLYLAADTVINWRRA